VRKKRRFVKSLTKLAFNNGKVGLRKHTADDNKVGEEKRGYIVESGHK